jgi:hypothetical protein
MFSGSEIRDVCNSGFITAYNNNEREIITDDIINAIKSTIPLSFTMKEEIDRIRKWQDGRAVRASLYEPEDILKNLEYKDIKSSTVSNFEIG